MELNWGQSGNKTRLVPFLEFLDNSNPILTNHGLPRGKPYLNFFLKWHSGRLDSGHSLSPHTPPHAIFPSLSVSLSYLPPLLVECSSCYFVALPSPETCTCLIWMGPSRRRPNAQTLLLAVETFTSRHYFWPIAAPSGLLSW